MSKEFIVPADYCISICDFRQYKSFVAKHWNIELIVCHFLEEMRKKHLLVWGTGAPANWRVEVAIGERTRTESGYRQITGGIEASDGELFIASYDILSKAAQFEEYKLPDVECESWRIPCDPGLYNVRIVQLYDPEKAETEDVFRQADPHFLVEIIQTLTPVKAWSAIPWFAC